MRDDRGIPTRPSEYERRLLPDNALAHAPAQVVKANTAAADAVEGYRAAVTGQRTADIEARNAPGVDEQATKAALDVGKNPPKATAPAKREAAEQARTTLAASEALAADRVGALDTTIRENHHEWIAAERATLEESATKARAAVGQAAQAFSQFDDKAGIVAFLAAYDDRDKMKELRPASRLIAPGERVERTPEALMAALGELAGSYADQLTTATTALEREQQDRANNLARKAIRAQQLQERNRKRKTTTALNAG